MRLLVLAGSLVLVACAGSTAPDTASSSQDVVEGIRSLVQRPDGRFDVTCVDGHTEIVTADQLRANQVCNAAAPPAVAAVSYACDASANLRLGVLAADGTETTRTVAIGSFSSCDTAAERLGATRATIARPTIVGVCDASANLQRFGVMPTGALVALPTTSIGSFSSCDAAMGATNAAFPENPAAAMIDYTCDASANLALVALDTAGRATTGKVAIGSFSSCASSADALRKTRSDVARTVALGACDASANLQRFSATPAAGLRALAATPIGSFATCAEQAAALNR